MSQVFQVGGSPDLHSPELHFSTVLLVVVYATSSCDYCYMVLLIYLRNLTKLLCLNAGCGGPHRPQHCGACG